MCFTISVIHHRKVYHLIVETLAGDTKKELEFFKVYPKANPSKFIVLQSNRPVLLRHRLKHKAIHWQVIKGEPNNRHAFQSTIAAIEAHLSKEGL